MKEKVLIVEDEVLIAMDIEAKLNALDYKVVGTVYNSDKVHDAIVNSKPELVLLDINILGTRNGIELGHMINKEFSIPFVYITSYSDIETLKEVQKTRPAGYIVKPFEEKDLRVELEMAFFRIAQASKPKFPSLEILNRAIANKLTEREYEIVTAIKNNKSNVEMSTELFLSVNTIKSHIRSIYNKCSVNSRVDLLNLCHRVLND